MNGNDQGDQEALAAEWGLGLNGGVDIQDVTAASEPAASESGSDVSASSDGGSAWAAMIDESKVSPKGSAERVLNQEEIDSLLGFSLADVNLNDNSGIRAIIDSAMVSYERLPMLEIVFDRLVRLLTTSLRNFTSD